MGTQVSTQKYAKITDLLMLIRVICNIPKVVRMSPETMHDFVEQVNLEKGTWTPVSCNNHVHNVIRIGNNSLDSHFNGTRDNVIGVYNAKEKTDLFALLHDAVDAHNKEPGIMHFITIQARTKEWATILCGSESDIPQEIAQLPFEDRQPQMVTC